MSLLGPPETLRKGLSCPREDHHCPGRRDGLQTGSGVCALLGRRALGWGPCPQSCPVSHSSRLSAAQTKQQTEGGGGAAAGTTRHCQGLRWLGEGAAGTAQVWGETRRLCGPWFCPQWGRGCQCCPQPPGCWVHMGLVAPGARPNQMSQILSIPGSIPPWAPGARHIPGSLFSSVKWARCSSPGNQGWQGPSQAAPHHRGPWAWLSSHYSATACR